MLTTQSFLFSVSALYLYRRLRSELQKIRRKGALKTCGSLDRPNIESTESCSRCRSELGKIINRGALCRSCRLRVCKACREFSTHTMDWVCIVCNKQMWVTQHQQHPQSQPMASLHILYVWLILVFLVYQSNRCLFGVINILSAQNFLCLWCKPILWMIV